MKALTKEKITAEEILCKVYGCTDRKELNRFFALSDKSVVMILNAMEEYASQQPLSDEEIEAYFCIEEPRGYGCSFYNGLVQGAKAYRDGKIK
jgi:hypothetical protein